MPIRDLFRRERAEPLDIPANPWVRCGNERCRELIYIREFEKNLRVCQRCGYHHRLSARERIDQLLDEGTFNEEDAAVHPSDPLHFMSAGQAYRDKLAETLAELDRSYGIGTDLDVDRLLRDRFEKYRSFGAFDERGS